MPKSNQNCSIQYSLCDMHDVYSIAESDMHWMNVAITDIKRRLGEMTNELGHKNIIGLCALEHALNMYQYITENRLNHYTG
jgi:hypothetical protein